MQPKIASYSTGEAYLITFIGGIIFGWFIFSGVSETLAKAGAEKVRERLARR